MLKKVLQFCFVCLFCIFAAACATTKSEPVSAPVVEANATATAVAIGDANHTSTVATGRKDATGGTIVVCESTSCGERFIVNPGDWQAKYEEAGYFYEILDKGCDGFKVKPMALVRIEGTLWAIHLPGCCRGLSSVDSCLRYLENAGFVLERDGAESPRGGTGSFRSVMTGPIYFLAPMSLSR